MANNYVKGKCCICGKYGKLTFEHIPPKKALNNTKAKMIKSGEIFKVIKEEKRMLVETKGLKYNELQKGVGKHSLCESCNNLTGTYYGTEYAKFSNTIHSIYLKFGNIEVNKSLHIELLDFYPQRFAKQVLSLFCSTTQGLVQRVPEIKDLILDKNKKGIDTKKIKLSMFLLNKPKISYTGLFSMLKSDGSVVAVSEICAYPFGFVLEIDPKKVKDNDTLDITCFLNDCDYDDKMKTEMFIGIRERNSILPLDFRSIEEIKETKDNAKATQ